MSIYLASEIIATMTIKASSKSDAEAKYNAWQLSEACPSCFPLDAKECGCVEREEECDHTMELIRT